MQDRELIKVELLDEHPDHDGIYREDIIEQIAGELNGEWPKRHALLVRPVDGRYQVVSGHHRRKAAIQSGIEEVWCDVEEMADDEATIRLITDNKQGEKSPLQIGLNVLKFESRSKGGRGKKGGLSEYARRVGKSRQTIGEVRSAAEVVLSKSDGCPSCLLDKTYHLLAIHKLPEGLWADMVDVIIEEPMSVGDVERRVKTILDFLEEHEKMEEWQDIFPSEKCARKIARGETSGHFKKLMVIIRDAAEKLPTKQSEAFLEWCISNSGGDSWNQTKIHEKRSELEYEVIQEQQRALSEFVIHGDFVDVSKTLEDESVELIFTDPPYDSASVDLYRKLAWVAERVLIPGGSLICYCGHRLLPKILDQFRPAEGLSFYWILACVHEGGPSAQMPITGQSVKWKPMLWFTKTHQRFDSSVMVDDLVARPRNKSHHEWQQGEEEAEYYISKLTTSHGLVFDPFCGGGTTAVVANRLGRQFLTCDVDESVIGPAIERVTNG